MGKLIYSLILFIIFINSYADSIPKKQNNWKIYFAYDKIGSGDNHLFDSKKGYINSKFIKFGFEKKIKKYYSFDLGFSLSYVSLYQETKLIYNPTRDVWTESKIYENKLVPYLTFATKFHPFKLLTQKNIKLDIYIAQRLVAFPFSTFLVFQPDRNYILNPRLAYHFGSGISYDFKPNWGFFAEVYYLTTKKHTPETPYNFGIHYRF